MANNESITIKTGNPKITVSGIGFLSFPLDSITLPVMNQNSLYSLKTPDATSNDTGGTDFDFYAGRMRGSTAGNAGTFHWYAAPAGLTPGSSLPSYQLALTLDIDSGMTLGTNLNLTLAGTGSLIIGSTGVTGTTITSASITASTSLTATTVLNIGGISTTAQVVMNYGSEVRFYDKVASPNTRYLAFKAPDDITSANDLTFLLPAAAPGAGTVLTASAPVANVVTLTWAAGSGGVTNIATTSPISGGPITTTGTISLLVNVDFAFTAAQSITINAIGTTSTDGLLITNTTDSTAGVTRQFSPRIRLHGESWDTSGTPQNRTHDIILENQVTTSGTPTGALVVSGSKDGAAYFEIIRFGSHPSFASTPQVSLGSGALKFTDSTQSIVMTLSNSGEISWQQQNSNSGASAQAAIYCGNDSSSTLGKIVTTSTGNSAFAGVSSFNMVTVGAFPIGIVTQNVLRLTISSAGLFTVWDGGNFAFGTTTGTKHGTATSQKQSFWNATPVIQPTTGITGAAFVANSGTAVNDASTFGGYTIKQIAAVLQQVGLMA